MSLISGLYTSFQGIRDTEAKIAVSTQNITNADKPGYTRKEFSSDYISIGQVTAPISGVVESIVVEPYLYEQMLEDISTASKSNTEYEYLSSYIDRLGSVGGDSRLNTSLDELAAALDQLSISPESASLKSAVVVAAEDLANDLRSLSDSIQTARSQADQEIGAAVDSINTSLEKIDFLNKEIQTAASIGSNTADFEDERRVELEKIASLIDVNYYVDNSNRMNVYIGDRPVITSQVTPLDYSAASAVSSSVVYPGGFDAITIAGADITTTIDSGKIAGLINVRDTILVEEQQKLDEFANVLTEQMNTLMNQGSSIPPREEMIGNTQGLSAGTALGGTGSVRIAVTDQSGTVVNYNDFNLAGYATIGDMITDINTVLGAELTASLDVDGALVLRSDVAGQGISLQQLDSDIGGEGFSKFFELNNMFDSEEGAVDIAVSRYLADDPDYLPTSTLSADPALTNGTTGVFVGDGTLAKQMNEAITASTSFAAAGDLAAQTTSLDVYADNILGSASLKGDVARDRADTAQLLADQTQTELRNIVGVNIDEEMTKIVDLEAKYEAAATLIATIQDLFQELINAVR